MHELQPCEGVRVTNNFQVCSVLLKVGEKNVLQVLHSVMSAAGGGGGGGGGGGVHAVFHLALWATPIIFNFSFKLVKLVNL